MSYKKIFFSIIVSLLPIVSNAYEVIDGICYSLNTETKKACVVVGYYENLHDDEQDRPTDVIYTGDFVIPETFNHNGETYTVTSIEGKGYSAYMYPFSYYFKDLNSITIPQTITHIGLDAFESCETLKAVYISDMTAWCNIDFETIGQRGYFSLSANPLCHAHNLYLNGDLITDLVMPKDVNTVKGAFVGCNISSVTFHKEFQSISGSAFKYCNMLKDIYSYSPTIKCESHWNFSYNRYDMSFDNHENLTLHIRERYKDSYMQNNSIGNDGFENVNEWKLFGQIAYIEGIDYNLVYIIDDVEYKKTAMEVGEAITPEAEPTKEGYTFSGWSEIPETMPDHDLTIIGSFSPNTYKITYTVDGEEFKVVEVKCDEAITPEPNPTRKGMTFSGWSEIPKKMPAKDVTVTGTFSWSKITKDEIVYQVVDTLNNYSTVIGNENANGKITITSDIEFDFTYKVTSIEDKAFNGCKGITTIDIPATITTIGERAFANIDKLTDVTIYSENVPETNRTAFENSYVGYVTLHVPYGSVDKYKAVGPWKDFKEIVVIPGTEVIEKYKLTYMVDGEEYKVVEINEGEAVTPEDIPTKEGYTFSGWSNIPETMPGEDVTVSGTFTINKYKLVYMVDGQEYKTYDVEYNSAIDAEAAPTKEGYTFSGWSDIPETMPAKDVTVSGTFTVNKYKLTYTVDGESYKEYEVEYGSAITAESEPTKEGYTFSGWGDIPETMPNHDVVITGTFVVNKYKLIYWVDGVEYKNYAVEYGSNITPETEPIKEGYTFSGWSEIPSVMPAFDVNVNGSFTKNAPTEQCDIPVIAFEGGKLIFDSDTEDAEFHYEIKVEDAKEGVGSEVSLSSAYEITVYASKEGYNDSEKNTATLYWINVDPTTTGVLENEIRVNTNAVLVQNTGGAIILSGVADDSDVVIYGLSGQMIAHGKTSGNHVEIGTNLSSGDICIIKMGDKSVKYMLR